MSFPKEISSFFEGLKDPKAAQQDCLLRKVIAPNIDCEYGRAHNFSAIKTTKDYQREVPRVEYEDLRPAITRMMEGESGVLVTEPVRRYFITSGSTAKPKYIPVTGSFIRDKVRAFSVFWALTFQQHPKAQQGRILTNFADSGSTFNTAGGTPCSSESAFWKIWEAGLRVGKKPSLPISIAEISDTDSRHYTIARLLLEQEDISIIMTLNPSTIVLLFNKINDCIDDLINDIQNGGLQRTVNVPASLREEIETTFTGNRKRADALCKIRRRQDPQLIATDIWPELDLAVCWRSEMLRPYHRLLEPHLNAIPGRDYITMASEGILAIPIEDNVSGGVLATNTHFYEFIPLGQIDKSNPDVLLAHEIVVGEMYVVLLSTSSGLYRYNIGDVVRVTGMKDGTPAIEFLYRVGATCSLTGEKLTEQQVTKAFDAAAIKLSLKASWFVLFPGHEPLPHYVILVEPTQNGENNNFQSLANEFDKQLSVCNTEYESKRQSQRLGAPEVWIAETGSYSKWRQDKLNNGANDDQIKPIHLTRDIKFADRFTIVERYDAC